MPLTAGYAASTILALSLPSARSRARTRLPGLAVCLLLLCVLPGCLTSKLWQLDQETTTRTEVSERIEACLPGELEVGASALVGRFADSVTVAVQPVGIAGEALLSVLAAAKEYAVHEVVLDDVRVVVGAEVAEQSMHVALRVNLTADHFAQVVSERDLHPAAAAALARGLLGDAQVPAVCREIANHLAFADLARWFGVPLQHALQAQTFLDVHGQPAFGTGRADTSNLEPPTAESPLAEQLSYLSQLTLLVELAGPTGPLLLKVRPDRLWLLQQLSKATEDALVRLGHTEAAESLSTADTVYRIAVTPLAASVAVPLADDVLPIAATYQQRLVSVEQVTESSEPMSVWAKIAWTPVTLTIDLALGLVAKVIQKALNLDDDDDDDDDEHCNRSQDREQYGGLSDARPRRKGESEAQWRAREAGRLPGTRSKQ